MNDPFMDAVKDKIFDFNKTRGRRKELTPCIVDYLPHPRKRWVRLIDISTEAPPDILTEAIDRMAGAAVRTLLNRKPRPELICVVMLVNRAKGQYLFSLRIPKKIPLN